jgi:hypothetical protein
MKFLLDWSIAEQLTFIVVVFGGGSVLGLFVVRRLVPVHRLQENHEVAGVTFGALGAFYGLVLAFVIVAAWERFDQAKTNAHAEATALENLYKLGSGLDEPMRSQLDSEVLQYTHRVVDEEWPEMATMHYRTATEGAHDLWWLVVSYHPVDSHDEMLMTVALEQLNQISHTRSERLLFYHDDLPSMVWLIIYLGCVITIGFGYFFGSSDFRAQAVMCAFFSIWLGITILAILELAHPYHGMMTITDDPYRYAISRMEEVKRFRMTIAPVPNKTPALPATTKMSVTATKAP